MTDKKPLPHPLEESIKTLPNESLSGLKKEFDHETLDAMRLELRKYEEELLEKYQRTDDKTLILDKKKSFLQKLIEDEREDESKSEDELREEEHKLINFNFIASLLSILIFVILSLTYSAKVKVVSLQIQQFITFNFSWFYVLISAGSLFFLIYLCLSRFGSIVLGDPDVAPEFSNVSWYSMLFSAGMGVGILFYGAAEPISHFLSPPAGTNLAKTAEAGRMAMVYSAFHWGLNAWAIYVLCAVGVAYYGFRRRKKYLISSSIVNVVDNPSVRSKLKGIADLVSTLAVVFGVSASLGLGILQIASGLKYTYQWDFSNSTGYLMILGLLTCLFIASATTGLDKGIKILSNLNMLVAIALMLFVFFAGPTLFILKLFVDTLGQYIGNVFQLSFKVAPFTAEYGKWMGDWTLSYFTWWIAWAPFVGIFIARISKGRTIRELITGALVLPTIFSIFWFSVFGGSALFLETSTSNGIGALVQKDVTVAFFALLQQFPLADVTSSIAILLLFTFLVTSADSACFVISMMTTEGDLDPSFKIKVFWGLILATITAALLIGGGLDALRAAALVFAFPFSLVLVLIAFSLFIRLNVHIGKKRV